MITKLFEPASIGPVSLANRMIRTVMHLNYALNGHVTDRFLEFYRAPSTWRCGIDRHRRSGYQRRVIRHGLHAFHQEGQRKKEQLMPIDRSLWLAGIISDFVKNSPENSLKMEPDERAFEEVLVGFSAGSINSNLVGLRNPRARGQSLKALP